MAPNDTKQRSGGGNKPFVLRLPSELYDKLEAWADREFRSVNSLIVSLLDRAVAEKERTEDTKGNQIAEIVELAA